MNIFILKLENEEIRLRKKNKIQRKNSEESNNKTSKGKLLHENNESFKGGKKAKTGNKQRRFEQLKNEPLTSNTCSDIWDCISKFNCYFDAFTKIY